MIAVANPWTFKSITLLAVWFLAFVWPFAAVMLDMLVFTTTS